MLSPREHQSCWSRVKAPAAVSLACLAATLLIAAQGFRGHPTTKHSDLPAQHSSDSLRREEALSQVVDTASTVVQSRYKSAQEDERGSRPKGSETRYSASTETASSSAGLHKQKAFEHIEIATSDIESSALQNDTSSGNVTAYHEVIQGMEVLVVNKTLNGRQPSGILLIFHGCSHGALDWWYSGPDCYNCSGLPEEVSVTKAALRRDYAVVAFSSLDRQMRCWDISYGADLASSSDLAKVLNVWQEISERENWSKIPRYALGGSSGGAFVLHLAQRVPLDGVIPVIMGVQPGLLENKPHAVDLSKSWPFPPTFFIHMARDDATAQLVALDITTLKKQGVRTNEVIVDPKNLSASFFSDRIADISADLSAEMYQSLAAEGCLNATGFLIDNPRSASMMRRWQKALRENVASGKSMSFKMDESPVFEVLNVAWAGHELVSDYMDECLDWFTLGLDGPKLMTAVNPRLQ